MGLVAPALRRPRILHHSGVTGNALGGAETNRGPKTWEGRGMEGLEKALVLVPWGFAFAFWFRLVFCKDLG